MDAIERKTDSWGSKFGFIMAAVGSSVGLGNFWRFPSEAGSNGGAAFIVIYLVSVVLFALPVLMAEYGLGRKSGMSAVEGIYKLAGDAKRSLNWGIVGWVGTIAAFFILTFYSVIAAWIIAFIPRAFDGTFQGIIADAAANPDVTAGEVSGANFGATIGNQPVIMFCLFLFLAANTAIVARGIHGGIERAATILMPAFFVLLLGLVVYALVAGDAAKAADFLLTPDFSEVSFGTFLAAVGQAFFSISVGSAMMMTYGAYLTRDTNIPRSSVIVAGCDTLVAIIAGFAIFPIVFAFGAAVDAGPGLFFVSLPIAFGTMPGGEFVGGAFFLLALFAALTSSLSLMEVSVSWLEERHGVNRIGASLGIGYTLFVIGNAYIYSTNYIDFTDFMTGYVMLPLGGLLVAWFAGRVLTREMLVSEFGDGQIMNLWRFACRWIVPPALLFILVFGILDKIQEFGINLPGFLMVLLGPNG